MSKEEDSFSYSLDISGPNLGTSDILAVHIDEAELTVNNSGFSQNLVRPLVLRALGHTNEEVGALTYRENGTIRCHLTDMYRKLGAQGIFSAVSLSFERGIFTVTAPLPVKRMPLSGREIQVVKGMAAGLHRQRVADQLGLSDQTVKRHIKRIAEKADIVGYGTELLILFGYLTGQIHTKSNGQTSNTTAKPETAPEVSSLIPTQDTKPKRRSRRKATRRAPATPVEPYPDTDPAFLEYAVRLLVKDNAAYRHG